MVGRAQNFLCTLPFYTDALRDKAGRLYGPASGPLTLERFVSLCGEDPDDERLWISLFRVYGRAYNLLGLQSAEKKLRASIAESTGDGVTDLDSAEIPPKLEAILDEIRSCLKGAGEVAKVDALISYIYPAKQADGRVPQFIDRQSLDLPFLRLKAEAVELRVVAVLRRSR